jgi:hypothetical protein
VKQRHIRRRRNGLIARTVYARKLNPGFRRLCEMALGGRMPLEIVYFENFRFIVSDGPWKGERPTSA